jgi:hypothetical protein
LMNTKDFLRLVRFRLTTARPSVPLGQATRLPPSFPSPLRFDAASHFGATGATDFISKFILGGGASGSAEFIPLHRPKRRDRRAPV